MNPPPGGLPQGSPQGSPPESTPGIAPGIPTGIPSEEAPGIPPWGSPPGISPRDTPRDPPQRSPQGSPQRCPPSDLPHVSARDPSQGFRQGDLSKESPPREPPEDHPWKSYSPHLQPQRGQTPSRSCAILFGGATKSGGLWSCTVSDKTVGYGGRFSQGTVWWGFGLVAAQGSPTGILPPGWGEGRGNGPGRPEPN